jgi:putative flippase GtrA
MPAVHQERSVSPLLKIVRAADRLSLRFGGPALMPLCAAFARFLMVGGAGLAVDAGLFTLLSHAGLGDAAARAGSLGAATLLTWGLNRRFTFAASGRRHGAELARYTLVALSAQGLNYALFLALREAVPVLPALGALLCGAAFAALFSFTGQRLITFAPATAHTA